MEDIDEILTLRVKKSKVKAFRNLLKLFDFVKLETPSDRLERYIQTSPKDVLLTDDDIMDIIKSR